MAFFLDGVLLLTPSTLLWALVSHFIFCRDDSLEPLRYWPSILHKIHRLIDGLQLLV